MLAHAAQLSLGMAGTRLKTTSFGALFSHAFTAGSRAAQWGQPYQKNSITSIFPPPSVGWGGLRSEYGAGACDHALPAAANANRATKRETALRKDMEFPF